MTKEQPAASVAGSNRPNRIVSHAGGGARFAANSLAGIVWAAELGVERIEIDVRRTADGVLVLYHDPTSPDGRGGQTPISALTFAELTQTNEVQQTVATLHEVCWAIARSRVELVIDLKSDPGARTHRAQIEHAFTVVDAHELKQRTIFHSDSVELLRELLSIEPDIITGAAVGCSDAEWDEAAIREELATLQASSIREAQFAGSTDHNVPVEAFAPLLATAKQMNLVPGVWTINDPEDIALWLRQPIRFLTTDYPAEAMTISGSTGHNR